MFKKYYAYVVHAWGVFSNQPFTVIDGAQALARFYYWFLWKRYMVRFFVGRYHDIAMFFDTRHDGCALGYYAPNHDYEVLALIDRCSKMKNKTFVDVGVNVGSKSLYALKNGYRVVGFEPNPDTARIVTISILLNSFEDRIRLVRSAVSKKVGKATFFVNRTNMSQSSLYFTSNEKIHVPITTLDRELDPTTTVTILKIDAEGAELEVLEGAQKLLRSKRLPIIHWEIARDPDAPKVKQTFELLRKYGYRHFGYDCQTGRFHPYTNEYNCISLLPSAIRAFSIAAE